MPATANRYSSGASGSNHTVGKRYEVRRGGVSTRRRRHGHGDTAHTHPPARTHMPIWIRTSLDDGDDVGVLAAHGVDRVGLVPVDKDDDHNVVADKPLALHPLLVGLVVLKQGRDVEHHLHALVVGRH